MLAEFVARVKPGVTVLRRRRAAGSSIGCSLTIQCRAARRIASAKEELWDSVSGGGIGGRMGCDAGQGVGGTVLGQKPAVGLVEVVVDARLPGGAECWCR